MTENKLTEAEIMKALEICCNSTCSECDFGKQCNGYTTVILALDLINRKNAEIVRLEKAIQVQEFMLENQDYKIKKAMGGAIKSFAERLKKCFCNFPIWGKVAVGFMEEVAKEMGVEL